MKVIVIVAILAFLISSGTIMFFTGTFKRIPPGNAESGELDQAGVAKPPAGEQGEASQSDADESALSTLKIQAELVDYKAEITALEAGAQAKLAEFDAQIAEAESKLAAIKAEIKSLTNLKVSMTRSQQLAKVYTSMRPDSAASIMCELGESLTKQILSEMSDKSAGKIMEAIAKSDPSYGAKISKIMANES